MRNGMPFAYFGYGAFGEGNFRRATVEPKLPPETGANLADNS